MTIVKRILSSIASVCCLGVVGTLVFFMVYEVHPEQTSVEKKAVDTMVLSESIDNQTSNLEINVLNNYMSENSVIKKIYKIEKGQEVPTPIAENRGTLASTDAAKVQTVIDYSQQVGLLDGQSLVFNENANFYPGGYINFYCDETILAICWQEVINGCVCTFTEVKVGDASQIRRKLAGDSYGSGRLMYLTELYNQSNAVVAMNADFYSFRNLGVTCYEGQIRRTEESLDLLFIDENGDFLFLPRGLGKTTEDYQQYVDEHNVDFSLAFGPILVQDGVLQNLGSYPIGETTTRYSRAAICQVDTLHYLYCQVGHYTGYHVATIQEMGDIIASKNVKQAYELDGGQTGEVVMNGSIINHIDFGSERTVSDMIYFATAYPNETE